MNNSILAQQLAGLSSLFESFPIEFVYLHGSVALGCETPLSDIDLAVVAKEDVEPKKYLDLELDLEVKLGEQLKTDKLDVRICNLAPLEFLGQVLKKGILIYSLDEKKRVAFETFTRERYFDFLPVIRQMNQAFVEHLGEGAAHG